MRLCRAQREGGMLRWPCRAGAQGNTVVMTQAAGKSLSVTLHAHNLQALGQLLHISVPQPPHLPMQENSHYREQVWVLTKTANWLAQSDIPPKITDTERGF